MPASTLQRQFTAGPFRSHFGPILPTPVVYTQCSSLESPSPSLPILYKSQFDNKGFNLHVAPLARVPAPSPPPGVRSPKKRESVALFSFQHVLVRGVELVRTLLVLKTDTVLMVNHFWIFV